MVAEKLRADDFAFGESGAAYIATHPAQAVLRLHPDGGRETIAGPHEGAVGSTACAFGRGAEDCRARASADLKFLPELVRRSLTVQMTFA